MHRRRNALIFLLFVVLAGVMLLKDPDEILTKS
jgi:hypothetical protein